MYHDYVRILTRFGKMLIISLMLLALDAKRLGTAEQLPERIPTMRATTDRAVEESVRAVREIPGQAERQETLTRLLDDLRILEAADYRPIVAAFQEELVRLDGHLAIPSRPPRPAAIRPR